MRTAGRTWLWGLAAGIAWLVAGWLPLAGQEGRLPTAADFVDVAELDDVRLSPDGAWVAALVREAPDPLEEGPSKGDRVVMVAPSDGRAAPRRISGGLGAADAPAWGPDGTLAFVSEGERAIFLYSVGAGRRARAVEVPTPPSRLAWSPEGDELAFLAPLAGGQEEDEVAAVWILDVATGASRALTSTAVDIRDMTWSPSGEALAVIASDAGESDRSIRIVDREGGMRTIASGAGGPSTRRQVLDWSPDQRWILYSRDAPDDQVGQLLALVSPDGGAVRTLLPGYEGIIMRAVWDPSGRGILAQSFEGLMSYLLRIDPETESVTRLAAIRDGYPTSTVSRDGSTFAFRGERLAGAADVWVLREGGEPRRITNLNPHLDDLALGAVRAFTWTQPEDGTEVQGVLVLPPDYVPGRAYPTVVQLHGGPHFHWGLQWLGSWHDWGQLLASRGYVVFHPNPRGSTGRGIPFASAIVHDVGGIDFRDVMAGVDALVAAGIADPDRLGVGGWSYGGFLTARTITQTDRFKAAIVGAGISNLFSFAGTPGLGDYWVEAFFRDHPYAARDAYEDRSATTHLANVRTPTLVVHGDRDEKISVTQAWELYNGLRYLGIETDIAIYGGAGHTLGTREDRLDFLNRVVAWFDRYLGSGAEGAAVGDGNPREAR